MKSARKSSKHLPLSTDEIRGLYPEFSRLLLARQKEIIGQDDEIRPLIDETVLDSPGDIVDAAGADIDADYFINIEEHHRTELLQIRDAIERMNRGIYGSCESCEDPIHVERLKRLPFARLCIDCQSSLEEEAVNNRVVHMPRQPKARI